MTRSIRRLSSGGDTVVRQWDTETVSEETLKEIQRDYEKLVGDGHTPFDVTDKKDELQRGGFDPKADTLMIPRMQGGSNG